MNGLSRCWRSVRSFVDTLQDLRRKLVGDLEPVGSRGRHTHAVDDVLPASVPNALIRIAVGVFARRSRVARAFVLTSSSHIGGQRTRTFGLANTPSGHSPTCPPIVAFPIPNHSPVGSQPRSALDRVRAPGPGLPLTTYQRHRSAGSRPTVRTIPKGPAYIRGRDQGDEVGGRLN